MHKTIAISVMLFFCSATHCSASGRVETLSLYSSLEYNKLEGEYDGLEVAVLPYYGGTAVLWRSANGSLDRPLLLDATRNGMLLSVVVPEPNPLHGLWRLQVRNGGMDAQGPRGLHFGLKRVDQSP